MILNRSPMFFARNHFKTHEKCIHNPSEIHSKSFQSTLNVCSLYVFCQYMLGGPPARLIFLFPATSGMLYRPLDSLSSFRDVVLTFGRFVQPLGCCLNRWGACLAFEMLSQPSERLQMFVIGFSYDFDSVWVGQQLIRNRFRMDYRLALTCCDMIPDCFRKFFTELPLVLECV